MGTGGRPTVWKEDQESDTLRVGIGCNGIKYLTRKKKKGIEHKNAGKLFQINHRKTVKLNVIPKKLTTKEKCMTYRWTVLSLFLLLHLLFLSNFRSMLHTTWGFQCELLKYVELFIWNLSEQDVTKRKTINFSLRWGFQMKSCQHQHPFLQGIVSLPSGGRNPPQRWEWPSWKNGSVFLP